MEYYYALLKEILSFATLWMNLENIMLSEVCQAQKGKGNYDPTYLQNLEMLN